MAQSSTRDGVDHYLEVFSRRRWWVIIPAIVIATLTVPIVMWLPATYRSTTLITVEAQKVPEEFVRSTVTIPIEERLQAISQQILSRTRLERVIEKYGLYREDRQRGWGWLTTWFGRSEDREQAARPGSPQMLDLVVLMKSNIEIEVPRARDRGNTISISFSGESPQTVQAVTNELASLFIEENLKAREAQAEGTTEFLETELQQTKVQLETHEQHLRAFKERSMGELPDQLDANLRTLDRLQLERQVLQQSLKSAEDRYADLSRQVLAASSASEEATPSDLARRLQTLRTRLADLRTEYRDEYPDIILLKKEIASVETELASQGSREAQEVTSASAAGQLPAGNPLAMQLADQQREINALRLRQQTVLEQIREYERRVENTPVREQQLAAILRDYENVQRSYQSLLAKRQDAKISESLERRQKAEFFRILDPANLPSRPDKPNRPLLMLLGIFGGLAAGLGLAYFREQLDPSIQSEEDLVAATTGLPLLAVIPVIPASVKKKSRSESSPTVHVGSGKP
ncbi:MAG: GNVR domain-containing protein [Nitrospirota bacterium]